MTTNKKIVTVTPQLKNEVWKQYTNSTSAKNELKDVFFSNTPSSSYQKISDKLKKKLNSLSNKRNKSSPHLTRKDSPKRKSKSTLSPKRKSKSTLSHKRKSKSTLSPKRKSKGSPKKKSKGSPKRKTKSTLSPKRKSKSTLSLKK